MTISITLGFEDHERETLAALYWEAFRAKLSVPLGPDARGLRFIARVLTPEFAFVAREGGTILGLAGFKTAAGSMTEGRLRDVLAVYRASSLWRLPIMALLERARDPDILLMDGICVAAEARGKGVGTLLLNAIKGQAGDTGCTHVRLDVIDSNPRARALYERQGFRAVNVEHLGLLRHIFGFQTATQMVFDVPMTGSDMPQRSELT